MATPFEFTTSNPNVRLGRVLINRDRSHSLLMSAKPSQGAAKRTCREVRVGAIIGLVQRVLLFLVGQPLNSCPAGSANLV